jgi:hypothetical protein
MRSFGLVVLGLVLLPAAAHTQSVKYTDLVGTWAMDSTGTSIDERGWVLIFRPDSSYYSAGLEGYDAKGGKATFHGPVYLSGDTLRFWPLGDYGTMKVPLGWIVKLEGQQLTLRTIESGKEEVYKRSTLPLPPNIVYVRDSITPKAKTP